MRAAKPDTNTGVRHQGQAFPGLTRWRTALGWAGQRLVTMGGTGSRGVYRSWVSWLPVAQALKAFR